MKAGYSVETTGFNGNRPLSDFSWTLKEVEGDVPEEH